MRKTILLLLTIIFCAAVSGQTGSLQVDSAKAKTDTVHATYIVYVDSMKLKVDAGFALITIAPLVFVGQDGTKAATDQKRVIKEEVFVLPKRRKIEAKDVIKFKEK